MKFNERLSLAFRSISRPPYDDDTSRLDGSCHFRSVDARLLISQLHVAVLCGCITNDRFAKSQETVDRLPRASGSRNPR
ncbi:Hypothetical protein NTJ_08947 [Nesidiocoris tenuis]|uniref:Uncharacterized protein n=1 Tax=Nesidiocoris tenuis TaxID=355587 RepID=A0ABN7AVW4_9HEMI|nr:Hypothetical protein NTJ_08947 [Nesidiocoris tenuis]